MLVDSEKIERLIAEVAAEEVMPRFEKLEAGDVSEKSPGDLVTIADVATERRLTPALLDALPGSRVVGEEAAAADPRILDQLAGDDPVWVVDPVDGTANYAAGLPMFSVMGRPIGGGLLLTPDQASWQALHEVLISEKAD